MKRLVLSAALAAAAVAVSAQSPSDSLTGGVRHIDGVEVTTRRIDRTVRSARPTQMLEGDELERAGIYTLSDAVKRFAGANVRDYGGIGGMKTVSVRNLGANHTAVSYDGVTVSNTQAGQIDLSRFATDNVQNVTLTIGEDDDVMQPARHYASAAVLSITSRKPVFADGRDWSLRTRVRAGSWGLVAPQLRYWQRLNDKLMFSLDGTYMRADGRYPYELPNGSEKLTDKRFNTDIYSWQGEANVYALLPRDARLDVKAQWFSSSRGLPGAVILYNTKKSHERMWDEEFFTQAVYGQNLGSRLKLEARAKYVNSWNRYTDTDVKYPTGRYVETYRQSEYYGSATLGWFPLKGLSLSLAEDAFVNTLSSNAENPADPRRLTSLTALAARYASGRVEIGANVVATWATEHVEHGDRPADRRQLSPSAAFSLRLLKNEALYFRAMYKHTFRLPTFNDLYYGQSGTITLKPEKADEYNIGLTWTSRRMGWLAYVTLTADVYHNDVKDKIVAFPTLYVWKMANFGRVRINGLNATMAARIEPLHGFAAELSASYMLQEALDVTDPASIYYKNQIPYTPRHSGNAVLTILTPWLDVAYTVQMCGSRYAMQQNTREYEIDGYAEHTLSVSRELKFRRWSAMLQVSVRNLTDERYEVIRYYPMPGRSVEATATVSF